MGVLYLVATPIGNLEDISLRALRVLRECTLIAAEDTRTTGRLLAHYEIDKPMVCYHEQGAHGDRRKMSRLDRILQALDRGDVALVSEAGTPLVSDPGLTLVRAAVERGVTVAPIPGPSATTAALSVSGLPPDRFLFLGFLPRKAAERRELLSEIADVHATLILYEAPHRLRNTLDDTHKILGDRRCAVCRELTKLHEEIWRGTLIGAMTEWHDREPRGEITLVIEGALSAGMWDEAHVKAALAAHYAAGMSHSEAARQVARQSGWAKSAVYALWPDQA